MKQIWIVRIHKPTGVLYGFYARDDATPEDIQYMEGVLSGEPYHLLSNGKIGKGKKRRRGVWQYDPNEVTIYFTCPWCGSIGTSTADKVGFSYRDSVWCDRKHGGCDRHLSLFYRRKGEERKDPYDLGFRGRKK